MIAVAGEALIDLVVSPDGRIDVRPGGGPYNAARTLARLGAPAMFLGRVAADGFGDRLRYELTKDNVTLGFPEPSAWPTTLAVATLDQDGSAGYAFYLNDTSAADVTYEVLVRALPPDAAAVHVGTLGLIMEPSGAAIERLVLTSVPAGTLVLLDPNCRPGAVADHAVYQARLAAIAARADIVKASTEDLAYLYPDIPSEEAAKVLLTAGTAVVLVTDGPRPARAFLPGASVTAPVPPVTVADTIGAGDSFGGGFLAWWTAHGFGRADLAQPDLVTRGLRVAAAVAALTCTRPGADPPTEAELRSRGWWSD